MSGLKLHVLLLITLPITESVKCPDNSYQYGSDSCLSMRRIEGHELHGTGRSWNTIAKKCADVSLKPFKWRLPKIDTTEKLGYIARLIRRIVTPSQNENSTFWIGLRRQMRNHSDWANSKYWMWDDKTTLSHMESGMYSVPWAIGQPTKRFRCIDSVYPHCVMAIMTKVSGLEDWMLKWQSECCSIGDNQTQTTATNHSLETHANLLICESIADHRGSPWLQWWFFALCAFFGCIGIALLSIICCFVTQRDRASSAGATNTETSKTSNESNDSVRSRTSRGGGGRGRRRWRRMRRRSRSRSDIRSRHGSSRRHGRRSPLSSGNTFSTTLNIMPGQVAKTGVCEAKRSASVISAVVAKVTPTTPANISIQSTGSLNKDNSVSHHYSNVEPTAPVKPVKTSPPAESEVSPETPTTRLFGILQRKCGKNNCKGKH